MDMGTSTEDFTDFSIVTLLGPNFGQSEEMDEIMFSSLPVPDYILPGPCHYSVQKDHPPLFSDDEDDEDVDNVEDVVLFDQKTPLKDVPLHGPSNFSVFNPPGSSELATGQENNNAMENKASELFGSSGINIIEKLATSLGDPLSRNLTLEPPANQRRDENDEFPTARISSCPQTRPSMRSRKKKRSPSITKSIDRSTRGEMRRVSRRSTRIRRAPRRFSYSAGSWVDVDWGTSSPSRPGRRVRACQRVTSYVDPSSSDELDLSDEDLYI